MEMQAATSATRDPRHVLVICVLNPDGKYDLKEDFFQDLKHLTRSANGVEPISEDWGPALPQLLFIDCKVQLYPVLEFLRSLGIEESLISCFRDPFGLSWKHVHSIKSRTNSIFAVRWFATRREGSNISPLPPAAYKASTFLPLYIHSKDVLWMKQAFIDDRDYSIRNILQDREEIGAMRHAALMLSTPHLLIIWTEPPDTSFQRWTKLTFSLTWETLRTTLTAVDDLTPATMRGLIARKLHSSIIYQEKETLRCFELVLNHIDACMAFDDTIRSNIETWPFIIGQWKPYLHSRRQFVAEYSEALRASPSSGDMTVPTAADA